MKTLALCSLILFACGGSTGKTPHPVHRAPDSAGIVEVTVVSAEIRGHMANGEEWDASRHHSNVTPPALARYLSYHPELSETEDTIGIPIDDRQLAERAGDSKAADPMVFVQIGERVFRSPIRPRAFQPNWDFTFLFSMSSIGRDVANATLRIHVVDYDGAGKYDTIGSTVLSVREFLSKPIHTLGPFGAVDTLIIQTRMLPDSERQAFERESRVAIPGSSPWTDTGITVFAGQQLHIRATDEVCFTDGDRMCTGPEGLSYPHRGNQPEFKRLGHGTLIAAIGDTRFAIGRDLRFVAPSTGVLRLGVNDRNTDNNRSAYTVHVIVGPPR